MDKTQGSAQAKAIPSVNRLFMAGTVVSLTETGCILRTSRKGIDRVTRKEKVYTDEHPIVIGSPNANLDVGARIQFYGLIMASENRIQRVHAYGQTLDKTEGPDANEIKLQGKLSLIRYYPPKPEIGKEGFAEALIDVTRPGGERQNIRVKMFQQMAMIWSRTPIGSDVLVMGRVNDRPRDGYVDPNGDMAIYTEVIADEKASHVVRRAVVVDRFAGVDFDALEAGLAPAMGLKEKPEEEPKAEPAPAKKGGRKKQAPAEAPADEPF